LKDFCRVISFGKSSNCMAPLTIDLWA